MLKVNLWDTECIHSIGVYGYDTFTHNTRPTKIQYSRNNLEWNGITIYTNNCVDMVNTVKSTTNIAWMCEARSILPLTFDRVIQLEDKFDYILTWYEDLLQRNPSKYKRLVNGTSRVFDDDRKIHNKTKLCSHLISKQTTTKAHRFRHILGNLLNDIPGVSIFGPNNLSYPIKADAHRDFMFSIVIMNSCENFYFTEYLIDAIMCGTIPIFYGCPKIGDFFNTDGIIHITDLNVHTFLNIVNTLTPELYYSKLDAVKDNFQRAHKYLSTDDMLADVILELTANNGSNTSSLTT